MRTLVFSQDKAGTERFEVIWQGLTSAQLTASIPEMRVALRLTEKMEGVSKVAEDSKKRTLTGEMGAMEVVLEEDEWAMAKRLIESVPWMPVAAKFVIPVIDWLEQIPKVA